MPDTPPTEGKSATTDIPSIEDYSSSLPICKDIRRLSPAGLRWLYDWMGDTFDLQERP